MKFYAKKSVILKAKIFTYQLYSHLCSQIGNILNLLPSKITDSRFNKYQTAKSNNFDSILMMDFGSITRMRSRTFYTKEPETIEWINSFHPNSTFLDIGTNVGCYSIYAAKKNHKVISVEPDPSNFAVFLRNIYLNSLQLNIIPILAALSGSRSLINFNLNSLSFGGALHSASDSSVSHYNFMCFTTTVDDLIYEGGYRPNYLKIDVDGLESVILSNSKKLLNSKNLKSVLVELEKGSDEEVDVISQLSEAGFKLASKKHGKQFDNGPYKNFYNYIFTRPE